MPAKIVSEIRLIDPDNIPDFAKNFFESANDGADSPSLNFSNNPINEAEIVEATNLLEPKLLLDMIGVSLFFIKKYINILSSPLSHIFSLSLRNGVVPIQLKIAKVVPVLNLVINNPWTIIALFHCFAIFQKS
jgi:hypothetical protein